MNQAPTSSFMDLMNHAPTSSFVDLMNQAPTSSFVDLMNQAPTSASQGYLEIKKREAKDFPPPPS
jgi:hypothetical protein